MNKRSAFDRIQRHMADNGCDTPVSSGLREDLETIVRRCNEVRSLGAEYGSVELSPYMVSLMRVSTTAPSLSTAVGTPAAASV